MHETSARTWCTGKTQRDRVVREVGGGIGMGNTCKPMAVSFQCMTQSTTIKKKKNLTWISLELLIQNSLRLKLPVEKSSHCCREMMGKTLFHDSLPFFPSFLLAPLVLSNLIHVLQFLTHNLFSLSMIIQIRTGGVCIAVQLAHRYMS